MTKQDEEDLARFRAKERGELIDNLYRANILKSYVDVPFTNDELKYMWKQVPYRSYD